MAVSGGVEEAVADGVAVFSAGVSIAEAQAASRVTRRIQPGTFEKVRIMSVPFEV